MGFRNGAYAKVWSVEPMSEACTKLRLSTSHKNREGEYEQDFSGYVLVCGSAPAAMAAHLQEGSRVRLGETEVTTTYDKASKRQYTNFKVFSLESADGGANQTEPRKEVDAGEPDDRKLPF